MNKKRLIIATLLLFVILIGVTSAFLMSSNTKINRFKISSNESKITETFKVPESVNKGDEIKKEVKVKNNGDESYIRMYVAISDNIQANNIKINFNTADWNLGSDGYYYYNKTVKKGESTSKLFDKVSILQKVDESKLKIICYSESVLAQGYSNAKEAFNSIN